MGSYLIKTNKTLIEMDIQFYTKNRCLNLNYEDNLLHYELS